MEAFRIFQSSAANLSDNFWPMVPILICDLYWCFFSWIEFFFFYQFLYSCFKLCRLKTAYFPHPLTPLNCLFAYWIHCNLIVSMYQSCYMYSGKKNSLWGRVYLCWVRSNLQFTEGLECFIFWLLGKYVVYISWRDAQAVIKIRRK